MALVHAGSGILRAVGEQLAAPGLAAEQPPSRLAISPSPAQGSSTRPRVPASGGMNREAVASATGINHSAEPDDRLLYN